MTILDWLDHAGVAVFAATGALAASRKQLDLIGFLFLACLTGIGGGTLRDLILGLTPVFWVREHVYILICSSVAVIIFFTAHRLESRYRLLLWLDAAGLAGEPSVLMRREIYVTAALLGSSAYVLAMRLGLDANVASGIAFTVAFVTRGGALRYGWTMPSYKSAPGRPPEDVM